MVEKLNKESRRKLLREANPAVQELYGGEENGASISNLANKLGIEDDLTYETLALTIGDVILGSYKVESLGQLLKDRLQFSDEQITLSLSELQNFLEKIKKTRAELGTDSENSAEKPEPIKTMESDLHNIHGYGYMPKQTAEEPGYVSSQEDVFSKNNPSTPPSSNQ